MSSWCLFATQATVKFRMSSTKVKWNSELTNHLLQSLRGFKPYGVDKHFQMIFIMEKFRNKSGLNLSADAVWEQIEDLYNIEYLTERETNEHKRRTVDYTMPIE